MTMWEKIKEFFGIKKKTEQLPEPKQVYEPVKATEQWKVEESKINEAKQLQKIKETREIQLLHAIKKICGCKINLNAEDMKMVLEKKLKGDGIFEEIQLSTLDLKILSHINIEFNCRTHEDVDKYINESRTPANAVGKLVDRVKQKAIETSKSFGKDGKEENALGYISSPLDIFRDVIREEQEKEKE